MKHLYRARNNPARQLSRLRRRLVRVLPARLSRLLGPMLFRSRWMRRLRARIAGVGYATGLGRLGRWRVPEVALGMTIFAVAALLLYESGLNLEPRTDSRMDSEIESKTAPAPAITEPARVNEPASFTFDDPGVLIEPDNTLKVSAVSDLFSLFEGMDYRLASVRDGLIEVPNLFLESLPADIGKIRSSERRKEVFVLSILPIVLQVNQGIERDRETLIRLRDRLRAGEHLAPDEQAWLGELAALYRLRDGDSDRLLDRVDIVPPSLALAQASVESGWGTSRFAAQGNALFGQRIFGDGEGIVPEGIEENQNFRVRSFRRLSDSVWQYMLNLNTFPAYAAFRKLRAELRRRGEVPQGHALVHTLVSYSERGEHYLKLIRAIIERNAMYTLDSAELTPPVNSTAM